MGKKREKKQKKKKGDAEPEMGYCPLSIRHACRRAGRVGAQAGRAGRCDTSRRAHSRALRHGAGYCGCSYSTGCIAGS